MKYYWTEETTAALKSYQQSTDMTYRNQIFEDTLLPALSKLAECVCAKSSINKLVDQQQLLKECISHCCNYLDRVDCSKNCFAYLQLAIKHYIFQECSKKHKESKRDISLDFEDKDGESCLSLLESQIEQYPLISKIKTENPV